MPNIKITMGVSGTFDFIGGNKHLYQKDLRQEELRVF
jgi:hypothetical protein